MTQTAEDQRHHRAVHAAQRAMEDMPGEATVIRLDDPVFHLMHIRSKEIRIVRVAAGEAMSEDVVMARASRFPDFVTKEIWHREFGKKRFKVIEIS